MRYAALGPGKRLRPVLTLCACEAAGGALAAALPAAAAVELLHAYTLVHDDLPAMDDDDERRGRPTVHRAFSESTAILAGDGLLTLAFACLADLGAAAGEAVAVLARAAGATELLAGQARDLACAQVRPHTVADLERIHAGKTGALFGAACELGAIAAGAGANTRASLARYGLLLGIAFQYFDDRDDREFADLAPAVESRLRALLGDADRAVQHLGAPARPLQALIAWFSGRV
jgi:geranylgeranyl pyrophosphate synthase